MARNQLAALGAMLADDTRAEILSVLMDGRAHTGGELAQCAGVSPSTASEHLSKLLNANLLDNNWVARSNTPRAIRVTEAGRIAIFDHFDLGDARLSA